MSDAVGTLAVLVKNTNVTTTGTFMAVKKVFRLFCTCALQNVHPVRKLTMHQ